MKFSLTWLKDHLETEASVEEIAAKLNAIGLEVEGIENPMASSILAASRFARLPPHCLAKLPTSRPSWNA